MSINARITLIVLMLTAISVGTAVAQRDLPAEERRVEKFKSISVSVPGEVYLKQGDEQKVIIEGTNRVVENLITEVNNGRLSIRMPSRWRYRRSDELYVYITMTELEGIALSGSASIYSEGPVTTGRMAVTISGSGRIELEELDASELDVTVSGSGRLTIGGGRKLEKSKIVISGSGRLDTRNLPVENADALITGSGNCSIHVMSNLNVRISGSGRVIYTGNPRIDARITGSGRVVNAN